MLSLTTGFTVGLLFNRKWRYGDQRKQVAQRNTCYSYLVSTLNNFRERVKLIVMIVKPRVQFCYLKKKECIIILFALYFISFVPYVVLIACTVHHWRNIWL